MIPAEVHHSYGGLLSLAPVFLAFSEKVRKEIFKRDKGVCQITGQKFSDGYVMHAAHLKHDKLDPDYDTAKQGILLSVLGHLIHHTVNIGTEEEIGLSENQNLFAIEMLKRTQRRTKKWLQEHGE